MKHYCVECRKEQNTKWVKEQEEVNVKGDFFEVELNIPYCEACGHEVFVKEIERENDQRVYNNYRTRNHLLTTSEIKAIRNALGLNQKEFAKVLGFGEKTITRYENGAIQDVAHDNLMRLVSVHSNIDMLYQVRRGMYGEKINKTINFAMDKKKDVSFTYKPSHRFSTKITYDYVEKAKDRRRNYEC